MQERRKKPRKALMAYTQVFDLYGGYLLGYLGDLNTLGAMVIGDKPMEANTKLTLAIELPELEGIQATRMTILARVAWTEPDVSPNYYNVGFEFQNVTPEQVNIIEAIMRQYEFQRKAPTYPIKPSPT